MITTVRYDQDRCQVAVGLHHGISSDVLEPLLVDLISWSIELASSMLFEGWVCVRGGLCFVKSRAIADCFFWGDVSNGAKSTDRPVLFPIVWHGKIEPVRYGHS